MGRLCGAWRGTYAAFASSFKVKSAALASNGTSLTITFSRPATNSTGFTISPSGGAATLSYVSGDGTSTFVYSASRTIGSHETVTLAYSSGNIVDARSVALASFSDFQVTNGSTQDTLAPTLTSATVAANGTTVTLVFSETVTGGTGFTLDNPGVVTLTYSSGSGTSTLVFTAGSTINQSDIPVLDYTPGNIVDGASNALASISNAAVTNNSTQTGSSLLTGLVSYWSMSNVNDASGNGRTLTNVNTVTFSTGATGNAAYFTAASSQLLTRASDSGLQMGNNAYTLSCWIYIASLANGYPVLICRDDTGTGREYILYYYGADTGSRFAWNVLNGSTTIREVLTSGSSLTAATWFHVVCWHDPDLDQVGIHLNGGAAVTGTTSGTSPAASSSTLEFGGRSAGGEYTTCRIDEVGIWSRRLTAGELSTLYGSGTPPAYPFS